MGIANCRRSSKTHTPTNLPEGYASSERTQSQKPPDTSRCLDESKHHCFVPISHLSGQNGTHDAQASLTLSMGFVNLTHGTFCLGSGRPGSRYPRRGITPDFQARYEPCEVARRSALRSRTSSWNFSSLAPPSVPTHWPTLPGRCRDRMGKCHRSEQNDRHCNGAEAVYQSPSQWRRQRLVRSEPVVHVVGFMSEPVSANG